MKKIHKGKVKDYDYLYINQKLVGQADTPNDLKIKKGQQIIFSTEKLGDVQPSSSANQTQEQQPREEFSFEAPPSERVISINPNSALARYENRLDPIEGSDQE